MSLKHGYELQERVQTLQSDIEELETRKTELERLKELVESSDFVEREARSKLGLKKKGEHVIIVPSDVISAVPQENEDSLQESGGYLNMPYPRRWLYYFFGQNHPSSVN